VVGCLYLFHHIIFLFLITSALVTNYINIQHPVHNHISILSINQPAAVDSELHRIKAACMGELRPTPRTVADELHPAVTDGTRG
jgi:hypothetical protein